MTPDMFQQAGHGSYQVIPPVAPKADHKRLGRLNRQMLERLQQGPATLLELMGFVAGAAPHSRAADLRRAGYGVTVKLDHAHGNSTYTLEKP